MNKILITFLLLFSAVSFGASNATVKHLKVQLISEQKTLGLNEPANLGLKFDLDEGWHVYWENPGDSGIPPKVKWILPEGFAAENILWPTPEKIDIPPLADFGYEQEVLFIVPLEVPATTKSSSVHIDADVKWLVCRQVCIPGEAKLDITLPVKEKAEIDEKWTALFQATKLTHPQTLPTNIKVMASVDATTFTVQTDMGQPLKAAQFFPRNQMQVDNPSKEAFESSPKGGKITIKKSDQLDKDPKTLNGILQLQTSNDVFNYNIDATLQAGTSASGKSESWLKMIFLAFIGGLILNLMPCVFPVLSMKVFGFLKAQGEEKKHIRAHAFFYTLGILVSFWVLVGVLLTLKAGGEHLGWGFQLQSPGFVGFLSCVLFLFGLSLVGVFDIGSSLMGAGDSLTRKSGNTGAFFTGVLATVVSTPCTAPFMGAAIGFALSQPAIICFIIFTSVALGLALPYVALSLTPSLGKYLPKPGAWMETVKQVTAFLIFATVVWLLWVLSIEAGGNYIVLILIGFLMLSFAAWLFHRWPQSNFAVCTGIIIIILALTFCSIQTPPQTKGAAQTQAATQEGELNWEEFSPAKVEQYRKAGKNVFVDFTAAWCVSCKVNELVVFRSQEVKDKLKSKNVALLKADWTNHDSVITETLSALNRSGVPDYALYEKNKTTAPVLLPEVISPGIVIQALDQLN